MGQRDKSRQLDVRYPMHTREGVTAFLNHYNHIKEKVYSDSDFSALIMVIDFEQALLDSGLTDRELISLNLVFNQDIKRVDVAKMMGVVPQTVHTWIVRSTTKLAEHYQKEGVSNAYE